MDNHPFNQEQLSELILITSERLGIKDPSIIEKDIYITQALKAFSNIKNENFQLIFGGGTSLTKAHRLVRRMSEDIDFKIKSFDSSWSKMQLRSELKKLHQQILLAIENSNFTLIKNIARNENRYLKIELAYPSAFSLPDNLRPHILLEFTASKIRLPTLNLFVKTLIQEVMENEIPLTNSKCDCLSLDEIAAEKWVALTRRISKIERGYIKPDKWLIRHLYDIAAIGIANKLGNDFFMIIKNIIASDAKQFKTQHPEYFNDPMQEINRSIHILENNPYWQSCYDNFIDVMVFDKIKPVNYQDAIQILKIVSNKIINGSQHEIFI